VATPVLDRSSGLDSDDLQHLTLGFLARPASSRPDEPSRGSILAVNQIGNLHGEFGVPAPCDVNDVTEPVNAPNRTEVRKALVIEVVGMDDFVKAIYVPSVEGGDHRPHDLARRSAPGVRVHEVILSAALPKPSGGFSRGRRVPFKRRL
jgi:hypothetical protein